MKTEEHPDRRDLTMSMRLRTDEAEKLSTAARLRGLTVGSFVRYAALKEARREDLTEK